MNQRISFFAVLLVLGVHGVIHAQERRFEAAFQLIGVSQHELASNDVGLGGRLGFHATPWLDFEGELSLFPADIPDDVPVSGSRIEGLAGVKLGPRFDRFAVFGKVRAGAVRFGEAPDPVPCIAIFPPPLACVLAGGHTSAALELGGGVEIFPNERTTVRFDISDLRIRYPGPAFNRDREALTDDFWGDNLRLSFSVGLQF